MKESEIRPQAIFDEYLKLSQLDGAKLKPSEFVFVNCVACGSQDYVKHIEKTQYTYTKCNSCGSVFCNPRPTEAQLFQLYSDSPSSVFWSKSFFPAVKESRREKIFRPRAKGFLDLLKAQNKGFKRVCEVGAGHGLLLSELMKLDANIEPYAVEPDRNSAAQCEASGIKTLVTTSEKAQEWHGQFDVVISSEVIEHVFSVKDFIKSLYDLTHTNGCTLVTGLGYEGFDILTLQGQSKSLTPPHHLNFLSVEGFEALFKEVGFKRVVVTTPGLLDVDIVLNSGFQSEFLTTLAKRGDEAVRDFQKFLSLHKMSSHIWIFAEK